MLDHIFFLQDYSTYIGFNTSTNELIKLTPFAYSLAIHLQKKESIEVLANKFSITKEEIIDFEKRLEAITTNRQKNPDIPTKTQLKSIERITIHISNSCNLRCSYCYAQGGNYNMPENLMDEKTADDVVAFLTNTFDQIDDIVFFGGEPLLNCKIIERICTSLINNKKIIVHRYNIITNGTIINDDILKILNLYIDNIVVSIDGPANINDIHRKYRNGKGSFQQIDRFIKTIQAKTNLKIQFESTFTLEHSNLGYTMPDIFNYLNNTYHINGSVMAEMKEDKLENRTANYDIQTVDLFFETLDPAFLSQSINDIIFSIAKGFKRSMCPIGQNIIAITTNGDIRLCHIILNENKFNLGSIYTDNIFSNKEKYYQIYPFLRTIYKEEGICKKCWASNLCGGCSLKWFYDHESKEFSSEPPRSLCEENKALFKKIILNLAKIQENPDKYKKLINLLKQ